MHKEVLKIDQLNALPILKLFNKDFYLAGGTAIALHIGHRYSLDFDLFTTKDLRRKGIKNVLKKNNLTIRQILYEDSIQLHCIIEGVKITFYQFPFNIDCSETFDDTIKLPDLLTLSAMKAYALGGRSKWKDYVDLYFIFNHYFSFNEVTSRSREIFGESFNEKLFRQQLAYFADISFAEEVEYVSAQVSEEDIKNYLVEISLTPF